PLPESLRKGPGAGQPGADSPWNVAKRCLARVGFVRSKNHSEHARPSDRNPDLRLLRDVSLLPILWSLRTVRPRPRLQLGIYHCRRRNWNYAPPRGVYRRILRRPGLRSILLFDAAQYSVSR